MIHLDIHYWKPGWVKPSNDEWREQQRPLLAGEAWIVDGNYHETLQLAPRPRRHRRVSRHALVGVRWTRVPPRGLRKPVGEMPEGCRDSAWRRLRDEWRLTVVIFRNRRSEPERERRRSFRQHGQNAALHVLRSKQTAREFLDSR